jgi:hypothetical protein
MPWLALFGSRLKSLNWLVVPPGWKGPLILWTLDRAVVADRRRARARFQPALLPPRSLWTRGRGRRRRPWPDDERRARPCSGCCGWIGCSPVLGDLRRFESRIVKVAVRRAAISAAVAVIVVRPHHVSQPDRVWRSGAGAAARCLTATRLAPSPRCGFPPLPHWPHRSSRLPGLSWLVGCSGRLLVLRSGRPARTGP